MKSLNFSQIEGRPRSRQNLAARRGSGDVITTTTKKSGAARDRYGTLLTQHPCHLCKFLHISIILLLAVVHALDR